MTVYKIKPTAIQEVVNDYQNILTQNNLTVEAIYDDKSLIATTIFKKAGVEEYRHNFSIYGWSDKSDFLKAFKDTMEAFVLEFKRRKFLSNILGEEVINPLASK
jgi:hypothetical protein